jgi:hypothetical protein
METLRKTGIVREPTNPITGLAPAQDNPGS